MTDAFIGGIYLLASCGMSVERICIRDQEADAFPQSLVTGRPSGIFAEFITCKIPTVEEENMYQRGEFPLGCELAMSTSFRNPCHYCF